MALFVCVCGCVSETGYKLEAMSSSDVSQQVIMSSVHPSTHYYNNQRKQFLKASQDMHRNTLLTQCFMGE